MTRHFDSVKIGSVEQMAATEENMEYVYMQGSEEVSKAGSAISCAAEQMVRAASAFEETARSLQRSMEDFLIRIEQLREPRA